MSCHSAVSLRGAAFGQRIAPGAGVNLDHRRAEFDRRLDLRRLRADEQRDADAGMLERVHDRRQMRALTGGVEPAFGGALGALLRHQADRMRPRLERDARPSRRSPPFRNSAACRSRPSAARMSSSRIWRRSSRRCAVMPSHAGGDGQLGGAHRIGMAPAARVADGGDVIDVDAEAQRKRIHRRITRSPGRPSPPSAWRATAPEWR